MIVQTLAALLFFAGPISEAKVLKPNNDLGKIWNPVKVLNSGASAYSNLTLICSKTLGILYKGSKFNPYKGIVFTTFETKD